MPWTPARWRCTPSRSWTWRRGTPTSHELLLRLEDGLLPQLAPEEFLPAVERTDLVVQLDRWVVGQAVAALSTPASRRAGLALDVNVSSRSLADHGFADHVLAALAAAGVEPHRIGLEVSGAAVPPDLPTARALAERLVAAGCRLALDDLGSGPGAFTYLQQLPFTALKIGGDVVRHADAPGVDAVLVGALVQVARSLGMTTLAQHVERPRLAGALRALGVDRAQGFHLGRPRPLHGLLAEVLARA